MNDMHKLLLYADDEILIYSTDTYYIYCDIWALLKIFCKFLSEKLNLILCFFKDSKQK